MDIFYLIESKSFYTSRDGIEHQVADGGELPVITRSYRKAVERMKKVRDIHLNLFGEKLTSEMKAGEYIDFNVLDRFETLSPITNVRNVVTLYKHYGI